VHFDPNSLNARLNLASALLLAGEYDEAIFHLRIALQRHPDYIPAYGNLGIAYLRKGDRTEARRQFERILALDPQNQVARQFMEQLNRDK